MARQSSHEKAAQAWCNPQTRLIRFDPVLAKAFADILDVEAWKPNLGLATTGELIDELRARCEMNGTLNYKTYEENNDM